MLRKFALAAALVMLCASGALAFSGGTGTSSDPYIIASASDINSMRGGTAYYKLSDDIQMSGYTCWLWQPVDFGGYFDGNGKNIYIDIRPYFSDTPYMLIHYGRALFGNVSGTIVNLRVEGKVSGYHAAGIVQNLISGGTIKDCVFSGTVTSRTMSENDYFEETLDVLLDYLAENYDDELTSDTAAFERTYIGGMYAGGIVNSLQDGTVEGCKFSGTVRSAAADNNFSSGGIAALMYGGNITGCSVNGDSTITGSNSTALNGAIMSAGGIAGYTNTALTSRIYSCTFEGEVESSYYAGGIAGEVHGTKLESNTVNPASLITASYSAGGIVGYLSSGGKADYNTVSSGASVSADQKSAGGVVGLLDTESKAGATVSNNTSNAVISGSAGGQGGIIGSVGSNTYIDTAVGDGNTYSGASFGIGSDRNGQATNGNTAHVTSLNYSITAEKLDDATYNSVYSHTFKTNTNASLPITWELSGDLPSGMNFADGVLSGTPSETGTFAFRLKATIDETDTPVQNFTLTVNPTFTITLPAEANEDNEIEVAAGDAINLTFTGPAGSTLTVSGLPSELGNPSGSSPLTITGIITVPGSYAFEVTGEYDGQTSTTGTLTLIVHSAITLTTTVLDPNTGSAYSDYSADIEFSPSSASSITGTDLNVWLTDNPDWLSISKVTQNGRWLGRLSGTPTESGDFSFTVNVSLNVSTRTFTASRDYELYIDSSHDISTASFFTITTNKVLPHAKLSSDYAVTLSTDASADETVTWSVAGGALPVGFVLDSGTGTISGFSSAEGTYNFTVRASTSSFRTTKDFVLTVGDEMIITTSSQLPTVDAGSAVSITFTIDDDTYTSLTWSVVSGSIPPGLTLDQSSGTLSGNAQTAGTYKFTVQGVSGYAVAEKEFTLKVELVITSEAYLPNAKVGEKYLYVFTSNGAADVVWSVSSADNLPAGLSMDSDGVFSGTTTESGTYRFMVYAFVNDDISARKSVQLTVETSSALPITTASLPAGTVGQEYYAELLSPIEGAVWSREGGTLPPGLTLGSNGLISGTPEEAGTFRFIVRAAVLTREGTRQLAITIAPAVESGDVSDDVPASGGGGGCDSGFSALGLAVVCMILRRR
ncbi:MAG: putative Ig domain-containing protein [Synergistaceae bacterium]|nr:putative Ig domain-containing protein [Synergistaceae bacterium]